MKRSILTALFSLALTSLMCSAEGNHKYLFLCRSPLLAFDFWEALGNIQKKGVTVTAKIAEQVCNGMRAGEEPQCIRVDRESFKPIASGWGGALAMTDGNTRFWFHNPDAGGWVHPDYYVLYMNPNSK